MMRLPFRPLRSATAAVAGPPPATDPRILPGETLADATARRLGIRADRRPPQHPDTVPHLLANRDDRRRNRSRADVLAGRYQPFATAPTTDPETTT